MPKPVNQAAPRAMSTRIFAGLMSLWIKPRPWTCWSASDSDGDMQDLSHLKRPPQQPVERLAARICEHQRRAILALRERQRPRRPERVQFSAERVFMLEPLKRLER